MGIRSGNMNTQKARLHLTAPLSNGEAQTLRLEVTDEHSRMIVASFEMDAESFTAFMTNRTAYVDAEWSNALHRIGKEMQHDSEIFDGRTFADKDVATAAVQAWRAEHGWEVAGVHRNNVGDWIFTGRRWVEPKTDQQ